MKNIAVLASRKGSNFAAIIRAVKKGSLKANCALLVCDQPKAGVIAKARRAGIKVALIKREDFPTKQDFEKQIICALEAASIDLIVLAGFMRVLSAELVQRYPNRIINIHPALLPSFKGAHGIQDAFDYGVKITGVTVHFVDEKMDHGPIILQAAVKVEAHDTAQTLEAKLHALEHKTYPKAIQLVLDGKTTIRGRVVAIAT